MLPSRDQRIAILIAFTVGLLFAGGFVAFAEITTEATWCGAITKDEPLQKCVRDWVNAAGNGLTAVIASLAAFMAYGLTRRQIDYAALPSLEDQIKTLRGIYLNAFALEQRLRMIRASYYHWTNSDYFDLNERRVILPPNSATNFLATSCQINELSHTISEVIRTENFDYDELNVLDDIYIACNNLMVRSNDISHIEASQNGDSFTQELTRREWDEFGFYSAVCDEAHRITIKVMRELDQLIQALRERRSAIIKDRMPRLRMRSVSMIPDDEAGA